MYFVEIDGGARVGRDRRNLNVAHLQAIDVAEVEAVGGEWAQHGRFGVGVFVLADLDLGLIGCTSAGALDEDIGYFEVFHGEAGNAGDVGAEPGHGIVASNVGDQHALEGADDGALVCPHGALGTAQASAKTHEDGATADVAHGDVGDGDIF